MIVSPASTKLIGHLGAYKIVLRYTLQTTELLEVKNKQKSACVY